MGIRISLILIIAAQCIIPLKAQKKVIESLWQDQGIQSPSLTEFQEEKGILHLISNDADYLYVNLVIPGTDEQKKILFFTYNLLEIKHVINTLFLSFDNYYKNRLNCFITYYFIFTHVIIIY